MPCCGRVTKPNKKVVKPATLTVAPVEDLEYLTVVYLGEAALKVVGCYTKTRYWFSKDAKRQVEKRDANCLFDVMPGVFLDEVSGDNSETELEVEYSQPEID